MTDRTTLPSDATAVVDELPVDVEVTVDISPKDSIGSALRLTIDAIVGILSVALEYWVVVIARTSSVEGVAAPDLNVVPPITRLPSEARFMWIPLKVISAPPRIKTVPFRITSLPDGTDTEVTLTFMPAAPALNFDISSTMLPSEMTDIGS